MVAFNGLKYQMKIKVSFFHTLNKLWDHWALSTQVNCIFVDQNLLELIHKFNIISLVDFLGKVFKRDYISQLVQMHRKTCLDSSKPKLILLYSNFSVFAFKGLLRVPPNSCIFFFCSGTRVVIQFIWIAEMENAFSK